MEPKQFDVSLDIKRPQRNEYFEAVQGDVETNVINIALRNDSIPYDLAGTTVEISFAKADGTTVVQDASLGVTVVDAPNGKIRCELKTNTIAVPGRVRAEVRVLEGSKILTSTSFEFFVKKAIFGDDTIKSSNEWPLLSKLLEASNNEASRVSNENTRVNNENVRKANEVSRVSNETNRETKFGEMLDAYEKALEFSEESATLEVVDARVGRQNLGELNREIMSEINDNKLTPLTTNDYVTSLPESLDGIMNIDKIEGNTLQNLSRNYWRFTGSPDGIYESTVVGNSCTVKRIGESGANYAHILAGDKFISKLKPNTTYTIVMDCKASFTQRNLYVAISQGDSQNLLAERVSTTFKSGKIIQKIKTIDSFEGKTLTDIIKLYITIGNLFALNDEMTLSNFMIFEGELDISSIPRNYFEGIQHFDGGVIESVGVNSFDINGQYSKSPNTEYELKDNKLRVWNTQNADYRSVFKSVQLKPNTRYIISADRTKVKGEAQNVGLIGIKDGNGGYIADYYMSSKFIRFSTDNTGKVRVAFYSSANLLEQGEVIFSNVCIQEDPTNTKTEADAKPYKEDTINLDLTSNERNVFDGLLELGDIDINSGVDIPSTARVRSVHFIEIDPSLKYKLERERKSSIGLRLYDQDKHFLRSVAWLSNNEDDFYIFSPNQDVKYVRFIIETGSLSYKIKFTEINQNPVYRKELRRLPNGVADSLSADGTLTTRVGKVVLDGSETGYAISGGATGTGINTVLFQFPFNNMAITTQNNQTVTISDILPSMTANDLWNSDSEGFSGVTNFQMIRVRISKSKLPGYQDSMSVVEKINLFITWLKTNNITFYYELAKSTTEQILPLNTLKSFKNGNLIIDNLITPYVNLNYPTNLSGRVKTIEDNLNEMSDSTYRLWLMVIGLADKQLQMSMIQNLTTETNVDLKNKINEILTIWR